MWDLFKKEFVHGLMPGVFVVGTLMVFFPNLGLRGWPGKYVKSRFGVWVYLVVLYGLASATFELLFGDALIALFDSWGLGDIKIGSPSR